ncbi:MAG TPA: methionyl-tRNA formyltransferase [Gemmatimonadetes bacterium]|nr:methionyl-tRNA formyltransferase [Gemmatimonadota bacterium]
MKILFWGTPDFSVPSLRALSAEGHEIVGVVTQPDRPAGRGRRLRPSSVKKVALAQDLPVFTPELPSGEAFLEEIGQLGPDISVVVAYGHILRPEVLDLPPMGSINVHASLLPELRGAAPINWAIARGLSETGVTIMRMAEGMDSGAIICQVAEPILEDETASELTVRLSEIGAVALVEALALISEGATDEQEQDHVAATFAPKVSRHVARISWTRPAHEVSAHVRAMDAVPGAWTKLGDAPVKLFRPAVWGEARVRTLEREFLEDNVRPTIPGDSDGGLVIRATVSDGVVVRCASGAVAFSEAQPPGRKRMPVSDWINGRGINAGQRLV